MNLEPLRAVKPITTLDLVIKHRATYLQVVKGRDGTRYRILSGWSGFGKVLLDRWISDSGRGDDHTRPPFKQR